MGSLINLRKLDVSECENLRRLPEAMGSLINLRELDVSECENLESLPDGISKITTLKSLLTEGCSHDVKDQAIALFSNSRSRLQVSQRFSIEGSEGLESD
jgi:Leucine-rich repeat (LRR) protein